MPASKARPFPFGPEHRLHYRREYLKFFGQSQVFRLAECTIFRIENGLGHFRLGITIKARGSSVERNGVKRRIRENFRLLASQLGSFDYNVVIPAGKKMAHPYPRKLAECLKRDLPERLVRAGTEAGKK